MKLCFSRIFSNFVISETKPLTLFLAFFFLLFLLCSTMALVVYFLSVLAFNNYDGELCIVTAGGNIPSNATSAKGFTGNFFSSEGITFADVFNLCLQTFTTVGYGLVAPASDAFSTSPGAGICFTVNILLSMLAFAGILFGSTSAAIIFVKLNSYYNEAEIVFSKIVTIATHDETFPLVRFRIFNASTKNHYLHGEMEFSTITQDLESGTRSFQKLALINSSCDLLSTGQICEFVHRLDGSSPLLTTQGRASMLKRNDEESQNSHISTSELQIMIRKFERLYCSYTCVDHLTRQPRFKTKQYIEENDILSGARFFGAAIQANVGSLAELNKIELD